MGNEDCRGDAGDRDAVGHPHIGSVHFGGLDTIMGNSPKRYLDKTLTTW